jgi:hypothetical protein
MTPHACEIRVSIPDEIAKRTGMTVREVRACRNFVERLPVELPAPGTIFKAVVGGHLSEVSVRYRLGFAGSFAGANSAKE